MPFDLGIQLPGIYPKEILSDLYKDFIHKFILNFFHLILQNTQVHKLFLNDFDATRNYDIT